jgi:hypothetical protein
MKLTTLRKALIAGLACLTCVLSLASCRVNLTSGENGLYDDKNKITYCHASPAY